MKAFAICEQLKRSKLMMIMTSCVKGWLLDWHAIKFNIFHNPSLTNLISANQLFHQDPQSHEVREDFEAQESCDWFAALDFTLPVFLQLLSTCLFLVKSHLCSPSSALPCSDVAWADGIFEVRNRFFYCTFFGGSPYPWGWNRKYCKQRNARALVDAGGQKVWGAQCLPSARGAWRCCCCHCRGRGGSRRNRGGDGCCWRKWILVKVHFPCYLQHSTVAVCSSFAVCSTCTSVQVFCMLFAIFCTGKSAFPMLFAVFRTFKSVFPRHCYFGTSRGPGRGEKEKPEVQEQDDQGPGAPEDQDKE